MKNKNYRHYKLAGIIALLMTIGTMTVGARIIPAPQMYMFGLAASFSDSIVCFTDIQQVEGAWYDTKAKAVYELPNYSIQLRSYLNSKNMEHRTCMVFFNRDKSKLMKKYEKMKKLYGPDKKTGKAYYALRTISTDEFSFKGIGYEVTVEKSKD